MSTSNAVKRERSTNEVSGHAGSGKRQSTSSSSSQVVLPAGRKTASSSSLKKWKQTKALVDKALGPEWISKRPGPGGVKLHYLSAHDAIRLANICFGADGWSSEIKESNVDVRQEGAMKWVADATCRVRVNVYWRDDDGKLVHTTYHEGFGAGGNTPGKTRGDVVQMALKGAESDGKKRALRQFGQAFNCFYDKDFLAYVQKVHLREKNREMPRQWRDSDLLRKVSLPMEPNQRVLSFPAKSGAEKTAGASSNKNCDRAESTWPSGGAKLAAADEFVLDERMFDDDFEDDLDDYTAMADEKDFFVENGPSAPPAYSESGPPKKA